VLRLEALAMVPVGLSWFTKGEAILRDRQRPVPEAAPSRPT
jgi:hypothetical protein